jgi:UDP-glucose 4-epimerase
MLIDFDSIFCKKKVLITGGLGFIGSHLAERLVRLGADVSIIDALVHGCGGNRHNIAAIKPNVKLTIGNINNKDLLRPLIDQTDFIFNLAGQASHMSSLQNPWDDLNNNSVCHLTLLETCRHINPAVKIVYAGTRQVYGRPLYLPVNEDHPLKPVDYNGISKLAGEMYHLTSHHIYGLQTTSLRLTNVYGPHMRTKDGRLTFVGLWFHQLIEGESLRIFGNGKQIRDLNYIDDVVDAFLLAAASPASNGQVYNLGGNEAISLLNLAQLMITLNGSGSYQLVNFPKKRQKIDIGSYSGDFSKIKSQLGWSPRVNLQNGIKMTLDFYRINKTFYW